MAKLKKYRAYYVEEYHFISQPDMKKKQYLFTLEEFSRKQAQKHGIAELKYRGYRLGKYDLGRDEWCWFYLELELENEKQGE